jgi:hypothetical protein
MEAVLTGVLEMLEYQASEEHPLQNVEFDPPPLLHLRLLLPRILRPVSIT